MMRLLPVLVSPKCMCPLTSESASRMWICEPSGSQRPTPQGCGFALSESGKGEQGDKST